MLAKLARSIPDGDGWLYEPKWDGFRCIVFRDGDRLELVQPQAAPARPLLPRTRSNRSLRRSRDRCIVDGEIVVADAGSGNGLDFDALLQRIHPAESRIDRLAAETPAAFVAFDRAGHRRHVTPRRADVGPSSALARDADRRERRRPRDAGDAPIVRVADDWFRRFEGAGLDGVIAKPLDGTYEPGKRSLAKVKHQRTADCAVAGYRIHKDGNGVGSLLLGLFDDDGDMHSVGVAASFSVERRAELLAELEPRTHDALEGHPWREWAEWDGDAAGAATSGGSRWNAGKDLSFVPIRMGLVAEVTFGQLEEPAVPPRRRVPALATRPDSRESCRYDQLDVAEPVSFPTSFIDR